MITLLSSVFGVLLASMLLFLVRRDQLHISHGLGWALAILLCTLLGFAPSIFDAMASSLGVGYPPIMGVALAIAALVIKALLADIEMSRMKVRQQRLIQKVALLESELQQMTGRPPIDD